jgi:hypothetical protein
VEPKKPAKKRKIRWLWRFGARADAMMKIKKTSIVIKYTAFLPKVSENGPESSEPTPKPTRKRPSHTY